MHKLAVHTTSATRGVPTLPRYAHCTVVEGRSRGCWLGVTAPPTRPLPCGHPAGHAGPCCILEVSEGPCQERHRSSWHCECQHRVCERLAPCPCQSCGTKLCALSPWEGLPIIVTRAQHQEPCLQQELSSEMSKGKDCLGHLLTSVSSPPAPGPSRAPPIRHSHPWCPAHREHRGGHHSGAGYWVGNR